MNNLRYTCKIWCGNTVTYEIMLEATIASTSSACNS